MLSTLEGVLIALMVAFSPTDRMSDGGLMAEAAMLAGDPVAACDRYSSETAKRNCAARIGRPLETAEAVFPEQVTWVAPSDPGMPDRLMIRRPR